MSLVQIEPLWPSGAEVVDAQNKLAAHPDTNKLIEMHAALIARLADYVAATGQNAPAKSELSRTRFTELPYVAQEVVRARSRYDAQRFKQPIATLIGRLGRAFRNQEVLRADEKHHQDIIGKIDKAFKEGSRCPGKYLMCGYDACDYRASYLTFTREPSSAAALDESTIAYVFCGYHVDHRVPKVKLKDLEFFYRGVRILAPKVKP